MTEPDPVFFKNEILVLARVLIALLFVLFGWGKLTDFSGAVATMSHLGAPLPPLSAAIAVVMEVPVAIGLILGLFTRPLILLMAVYTLGTAFIGHPYWDATGTAHYMNEINFYKNISIIGGMLVLYIQGPGQYALDTLIRRRSPSQASRA